MLPLPSSLIALASPKTFEDKIEMLNLINHSSSFNFFSFAYYLNPAILELLKLLTYLGMFFFSY